jgi:nucleoside-diphosphate-sugar epimerase
MILIIGATSFIGPAVLESLFEKNNDIKCLVRTSSNTAKLKGIKEDLAKRTRVTKEVFFCTGNLLSPDSIFNCLKDIDSVVYLVDLKHTLLLKNLIQAITRTSIKRAVFISSTTVLVPQGSAVRNSKLESEKLIEQSGLEWTVLRPAMIYGTPDDQNYSKMLYFIKKRRFFVMFGSGQNLIQPVYVSDVANAVSLVLENKKTYKKTYEICGKKPVKYIDMLNIVRSRTKKPFKIIRLPLKISKVIIKSYCRIVSKSSLKPDMIERMEFDKAYSYEDAANDFGFSPMDFEQGIEKLIQDLQA